MCVIGRRLDRDHFRQHWRISDSNEIEPLTLRHFCCKEPIMKRGKSKSSLWPVRVMLAHGEDRFLLWIDGWRFEPFMQRMGPRTSNANWGGVFLGLILSGWTMESSGGCCRIYYARFSDDEASRRRRKRPHLYMAALMGALFSSAYVASFVLGSFNRWHRRGIWLFWIRLQKRRDKRPQRLAVVPIGSCYDGDFCLGSGYRTVEPFARRGAVLSERGEEDSENRSCASQHANQSRTLLLRSGGGGIISIK